MADNKNNTGDSNTGEWNTGHSNTGNWNTGNRNTGDRNTGNRNTGNWNTGYWNTGDKNTGDGCATDRATGFFCVQPQTVKCFDVETGLTYNEFLVKYPGYYRLGEALMKPDAIEFEPFKDLPGITPEKLKALHDKHLAGRK